MNDDDRERRTDAEDGLGIEPSYLVDARLDRDEIASIETALASATRNHALRRRRRWLGSVAVTTLVASVLLLVSLYSTRPGEAPGGHPGQAAVRAMVLEIQRTDIENAKPYKIFIRLESDEVPVQ